MAETKKEAKEAKEKKQSAVKNDSAKFKKEIEELKEKLNKAEKEAKEQKELTLRTAAEFDNFKKRTEKEKLRIGEYSKAAIIKQLLPTLDNAFRATGFKAGSEEYNKGIEIIAKQLIGLIDTFKLEPLAKEGDEFNPEIHEAVMFAENENFKENQIQAVLQQGYKLGDTVVRPAMVSVTK